VIVVKLGGSLYNTPELPQWLTALADYSTQHSIVIVPGGGPFADQVRRAQALHHFNDGIAHHMALIAMKQFGLLLASIAPKCQLINGLETPRGPFSIWLPNDELLLEPDLKKSWDISSDSIALWLTNKLDAEQLLLIKRPLIQTSSIAALTSRSVIDAGFAQLFAEKRITTKIINYQSYSNLETSLSKPTELVSLYLP